MDRFVSFRTGSRTSFGLWTEDGIVDLQSDQDRFGSMRQALQDGALPLLAEMGAARGADYAHEAVTLTIPVPDPEKIICVGVNFPDRNAEYKDGSTQPEHMSLFPRFPRSFTGAGQPLIRPPESPQLDYEAEIVLVIGQRGRRIPADQALAHVAGLSLCNEGTIRDWTRHGKFNVTQRKNWDRSGSIGPWIVPFTDPAQLADIRLTARVNGELRQDDRTSRMLFPFARIIAYVSTFTTLMPGDMLVCGTPSGAGARMDPPRWLAPGDVVEVEAEGIGILRNPVADEVS